MIGITKNVLACASCALLLLLTCTCVCAMAEDRGVVPYAVYCGLVVCIVAFVCYDFWKCRLACSLLSSRFMANLYFDIVVMLAFVPAYVEDCQEETWWPVAVALCGWCVLDAMRQLLELFAWKGCGATAISAGTKNSNSTANANGNTDNASNSTANGNGSTANVNSANGTNGKYRINVSCSLQYAAGTAIYYIVLGALLVGLSYMLGRNYMEDLYRAVFLAVVFYAVQIGITRFKVRGRQIIVADPYRMGRVARFNMSDVEKVIAGRKVFGRCLVFHYGYGKKATAYPSHMDSIVAFLKNNRIEVEEAQ